MQHATRIDRVEMILGQRHRERGRLHEVHERIVLEMARGFQCSETQVEADGVKVMLQNIDYWRDAPVWTASRIAEATSDWFRFLDAEPVA